VTKPVQRRELLRALREHAVVRPAEATSGEIEAPPVEEAPCDLAWLRHNYGDDEDVRSLVELFLGRAQELIGQLRAAVAADDVPSVRRHLHALKGITGTVAARPMYRLVPEDAADAAARLPALERAYTDLELFFGRELPSASGADRVA
jgi:HPt (histidine-containing phosphotransfer) domain-containing protein